MKKKLSLFLTVLMLISVMAFTSCDSNGKYKSSYNAVGCVHSNLPKSSSLKFSSFSGVIPFELKVKEGTGKLTYSGELGKGSATVYYDADGTKKELFSVDAGGSQKGEITDLKEGTVYVIVETNEKCSNGKFEFKIK